MGVLMLHWEHDDIGVIPLETEMANWFEQLFIRIFGALCTRAHKSMRACQRQLHLLSMVWSFCRRVAGSSIAPRGYPSPLRSNSLLLASSILWVAILVKFRISESFSQENAGPSASFKRSRRQLIWNPSSN